MCKITKFLLGLFICMPFLLSAQDNITKKSGTMESKYAKKVAVYLEDNAPNARSVVNYIVQAFSASKDYVAVERTDKINAILAKEREFDQSGEVADSQIAEVGQALGSDFVCIVGYWVENGTTQYLSARMVNTVLKEVDDQQQVFWKTSETAPRTERGKSERLDESTFGR